MSTLLTKNDVLLQWAFSEAFSIRWNENFRCDFNLSDYYNITQTNDLHSLDDELKKKLTDWILKRRIKIIEKYLGNCSSFELTEIPTEIIASLTVMQEMHGTNKTLSLAEYSTIPFDAEILTDARASAKLISESEGFDGNYIGYPVISQENKSGKSILIEGYTRCILLMNKTEKRPEKIKVIICK